MRTFVSFGLLCLFAIGIAQARATRDSVTASAPRAQVATLMSKALKDYPGKGGRTFLVA
jgi:hypothetical protein